MMSILLNVVTLNVRAGKELGDHINTEVGITQGDCLSAVLFIIYVAKSKIPNIQCLEHNYASIEQCENVIPEEHKHNDYYRKTEKKLFRKTTAKHRINRQHRQPAQNANVNETKTEEHDFKILNTIVDTCKNQQHTQHSNIQCTYIFCCRPLSLFLYNKQRNVEPNTQNGKYPFRRRHLRKILCIH